MQRSRRATEEPAYPVKSVGNALEILLMLRSTDELRVTQCADALDVAPSTAHRLLAMLAHYGFIEKDEAQRVYTAGPVLVGLGLAVLENFDLRRRARPHLEELASDVEETVNLIVLEERSIRFVDCVEGPKALRVASRIGLRRPANTTSVGKALLACLPDDELDRLFPSDESLPAMTERSVTEVTELREQLSAIRERGYATNIGESDPDIAAVGVAIRGGNGWPLTGIAVSVPINRISEERVEEIAAATIRTARTIEDSLPVQLLRIKRSE